MTGLATAHANMHQEIGVNAQVYLTAISKAVAAGDHVLADTTSGAITLTLPASPSIGNRITVQDAKGTWTDVNKVTIGRNGKKIHGGSVDLDLTTAGDSVTLIYNGVDDWRIL